MKKILTHINGVPIRRNFVKDLSININSFVKGKLLSEVLFWDEVRSKAFHNIDFTRRIMLGNYTVHFYVKALGLIIEIDDTYQDEVLIYEGNRQKYFESLGLQLFRITDHDIRNNLRVVMKDLEDFIVQHYEACTIIQDF
ncbi:DUF559 domain-containing protein [Chryseobacterium nematophagum]|uniref:DUF559 domain-containing protein n=1 Tax=Chryseobacterium nematophagum TaxID=2305228 RepID=A0A3M7L949_9FLAO|nr:DUF559 domain-containing protein [Chryseobacterium nematophagum]RMZ59117.1 DUF559 domain-containing protein [Chryseobacterium nematophagum]